MHDHDFPNAAYRQTATDAGGQLPPRCFLDDLHAAMTTLTTRIRAVTGYIHGVADAYRGNASKLTEVEPKEQPPVTTLQYMHELERRIDELEAAARRLSE